MTDLFWMTLPPGLEKPDIPIGASMVAKLLAIHRNTLRRISPKELPYFRIGNRGDRRYYYSDVQKYIESRRG